MNIVTVNIRMMTRMTKLEVTSQPEYKATVSRAIFFYFQWEEQEEEENQKNTAGSHIIAVA